MELVDGPMPVASSVERREANETQRVHRRLVARRRFSPVLCNHSAPSSMEQFESQDGQVPPSQCEFEASVRPVPAASSSLQSFETGAPLHLVHRVSAGARPMLRRRRRTPRFSAASRSARTVSEPVEALGARGPAAEAVDHAAVATPEGESVGSEDQSFDEERESAAARFEERASAQEEPSLAEEDFQEDGQNSEGDEGECEEDAEWADSEVEEGEEELAEEEDEGEEDGDSDDESIEDWPADMNTEESEGELSESDDEAADILQHGDATRTSASPVRALQQASGRRRAVSDQWSPSSRCPPEAVNVAVAVSLTLKMAGSGARKSSGTLAELEVWIAVQEALIHSLPLSLENVELLDMLEVTWCGRDGKGVNGWQVGMRLNPGCSSSSEDLFASIVEDALQDLVVFGVTLRRHIAASDAPILRVVDHSHFVVPTALRKRHRVIAELWRRRLASAAEQSAHIAGRRTCTSRARWRQKARLPVLLGSVFFAKTATQEADSQQHAWQSAPGVGRDLGLLRKLRGFGQVLWKGPLWRKSKSAGGVQSSSVAGEKGEPLGAVGRPCCVVCLENPPVVAFIPCGHRCLCSGCSHRLPKELRRSCPACRQPAADLIRIFD